jgi:RimJ/RimL family protein N-acetyltransferase
MTLPAPRVEPKSGTAGNVLPLAVRSLRNDSIAIGPVLPDDSAALFLWLNDVESARLDLSYRPIHWTEYAAWLDNFGKNPAQRIFAIRLVSEMRILGFVVLSKIDPVHRSAELGVRIGAEAERGKGYGKAAVRLALIHAWRHLNLNRVHLSVFAFNDRAIATYRAAGFQQEGRLREAAFVDGCWTDVVMMGALRAEMG